MMVNLRLRQNSQMLTIVITIIIITVFILMWLKHAIVYYCFFPSFFALVRSAVRTFILDTGEPKTTGYNTEEIIRT